MIGKSGIFGRSLALHTKEFISKDGEESYINFHWEMKVRVLVG